MGKLSGLITMAVFVGAVAFLVYLCCRNKRKRAWNSWGDVFGQNQQTCPANNAITLPGQQVPSICPPGVPGYDYDRTVPHSIVTPPAGYSQYPGANPGWSYPAYPGQNPNQTGYPGQGYGAAPYPVSQSAMPMPMPMPGTTFESTQRSAPYPAGYPEDLPPPYSAVVGSTGPKY